MMYSRTYYSKEELDDCLRDKVSPIDMNRIISAYDMADVAFTDKKTLDGSPYFFHTTRVCKILVTELGIAEPDLIITSLLHNVFGAASEITAEIIDYNFGPYVTYLLSILNEQYEDLAGFPIPLQVGNSEIKIPEDDYLIIWLTEHLDNFRSLEVSPLFNPINYLINTVSKLFPVAEQSENPVIVALLKELKQERNKILG